MKIKHILSVSILINIAVAILGTTYIYKMGGFTWISSKLQGDSQAAIPSLPLPDVDERILLLGDSHLAIHPWAEYANLPFSNRAVSGSRIEDIKINSIDGQPKLIVVSTSTNNLQAKDRLSTDEIINHLHKLFTSISEKWPNSRIIYVSPPHPNIDIYETFIRKKYPRINRPAPKDIETIRSYVGSLGIQVLQTESADIDGLHIDPKSAQSIAIKIKEFYANQTVDTTATSAPR